MIFDWDDRGWQSFVSDPEVPPIMQAGREEVTRLTQPRERLLIGPMLYDQSPTRW